MKKSQRANYSRFDYDEELVTAKIIYRDPEKIDEVLRLSRELGEAIFKNK